MKFFKKISDWYCNLLFVDTKKMMEDAVAIKKKVEQTKSNVMKMLTDNSKKEDSISRELDELLKQLNLK